MYPKNFNGVDMGKAWSESDNGNDVNSERRSKHQQAKKKDKQKRRHPLKMPLRTDPVTNRIICRFHNYDARSGCKKHNDRFKNLKNGEENHYAPCELDHETCHVCLEKGHPAHRCCHFENTCSKVWKEFCSLTLKNTRPEDYPSNKTVLGDPIIWIGDTATITVPATNNTADGNNRSATVTTMTTITVSPPKIDGFQVGEDDQLGRCRRQKKIEAAYMMWLGPGSVIVDVGAHLGDTVLTLAVHARAQNRRDLQFVALEPCPVKCEFIRSAVAANNLLETVKVRCAAVGDLIGIVRPASNAKERARRDGSLRYEYYQSKERPTADADVAAAKTPNEDGAKGSSNRNESDNSDGDTISEGETSITSVPIITLDSIFDQIKPLGMLHIDVEGWESNVLRGAKKSLAHIPTNADESGGSFPCFVIAESWTEKECLRRGVPGNAEEKIVRVMEDEVNPQGNAHFRFERTDDIVDIERNVCYVRKRCEHG
jgi:FkbM family methyltransferase